MKKLYSESDLFGSYYNQVLLLDYRALIKQVKVYIEVTEVCIAKYPEPKPETFEYACKAFADSVVEYAKAASDNILLGHLKAANILNRTLIENYVCLRVIHDHKDVDLWKYWIVHSFYNTPRKYGADDMPERLKQDFIRLCNRLGVEQAFIDNKKNLTKNYSWIHKVSKNYSFRGLCDLLKENIYDDYKMMSEFTHGTSAFQKEYTFTFESSVYNILSAIYLYLHCMMVACFPELIDENFALCDFRLEKMFEPLVEEE